MITQKTTQQIMLSEYKRFMANERKLGQYARNKINASELIEYAEIEENPEWCLVSDVQKEIDKFKKVLFEHTDRMTIILAFADFESRLSLLEEDGEVKL